ncbi:4738_t:CDS:2 [Funneliformis geosporum]|nr:4738_t:CDS:2 [Funneliformis geosporum]
MKGEPPMLKKLINELKDDNVTQGLIFFSHVSEDKKGYQNAWIIDEIGIDKYEELNLTQH